MKLTYENHTYEVEGRHIPGRLPKLSRPNDYPGEAEHFVFDIITLIEHAENGVEIRTNVTRIMRYDLEFIYKCIEHEKQHNY